MVGIWRKHVYFNILNENSFTTNFIHFYLIAKNNFKIQLSTNFYELLKIGTFFYVWTSLGFGSYLLHFISSICLWYVHLIIIHQCIQATVIVLAVVIVLTFWLIDSPAFF